MPKDIENSVTIDRHFYKRVLSDLYYINGELKALGPSISSEFSSVGKTIKEVSDKVEIVNTEINKAQNEQLSGRISENIKLINRCSSQVVIGLQFQDIIEQKLQHIINVHQELIEELYKAQAIEKDVVDKNDLNNINKVAQINTAQLNYILQEYKEAIGSIKLNLKDAYKSLKETILILSENKNSFKDDDYNNHIHLVKKIKESISFHKEELGTTSNFVISVQMIVNVLQKLFVANINDPFIIEGKWKKILDMYTIPSEIMVFEAIAGVNKKDNTVQPNNNDADFELF